MRKVIGTGLPVGNGVEIFHSITGSSKKILPINKEGLVLYIPVDSNYSNIVFDVSEKLNHGTRYGAIVTDNGKVGEGLQFDGVDDYVDIRYSPEFGGITAITVLAWIKTTDTSLDQNWIMGRYDYAANKRYWGLNPRKFSLQHLKGTYTAGDEANDIGITACDGNWHHVVGRWSAGHNPELIIDGNIIATAPNIVNSMEESTIDLRIGNIHSYSDIEDNFNGKVDEMKIYNRALSLEEIQAEYQREV